jgi:hypothetical protein
VIDVKRFSGVLNLDDRPEDIGQMQHVSAKNTVFRGGEDGLTVFNIKGNTHVANSNLPAGTNECIGAFYDSLNNRLIWFNYNQYGNHGIYSYSIQLGTITQIFRCGVNSASDVLTFSRDYPISSAGIVYRPEGEGDLLYWTDGTNRPMYLNLDTVSALGTFTVDMLYAAKMPPTVPPTASYTSDATKNFNNVKNRYFRFAYRWKYANDEKSTFSPTSDMPIPAGITNPQNNIAPNTNNVISVVVQSGTTSDFEDLEILGQEFNGTTWGDFFLITSVNKDEVGALPFSYTLSFYNDGIYSTIPLVESDLRFDYVPDKANALELLNGNTVIYGGITEGYDAIPRADIDVQVTTSMVGQGKQDVTKVWKWATNERLGLIYFDKRGKTNGVVSYLADASIDTTNFNVTTGQYPGQTPNGTVMPTVPKISASINHLPPSWAVSYQWVRIDNAPPFFLQYLTNDYQTDNDYIYLCIQGLIYNNTNTGFLPSYEFSEGDRVRVMGTMSFSGGAVTTFSTQFDYQVLDVVDRTMGGQFNTATTGKYLKVKKPSSFPTPAYTQFMVIEIYTPPKSVNESAAIFYEWGEQYAITGGYHIGQLQNQTASQPALFEWTEGYVYFKYRQIISTTGINLAGLPCLDRNYNDFQQSKANDNSRGWVIEESSSETYFPATVRWGGAYIQDTDVNNLNRFYPDSIDTVDRSKGDIRRFKIRDRILRVFQDRGVGQYGVYARFIQNNEGNPELVTTNEIITTNNIQYYQGTFGLGGYPTNLCSSPIADYFTDIVTGREIRLSYDGITDLGVLYKGQYTLPALILPYNKQVLKTNGTVSKVIKFFDTFDGEMHTVLPGGTVNGTAVSAYHYSFNEPRNGFCCDDYDYKPEWALSAADVIYSFRDGHLWKHDNTTRYCNFFGVQYNAELTVVFNKDVFIKKTWNAIAEVASTTWSCPVIYTNVNTYSGQRQQTSIVAAEFTLLEQMPSASVKRDANSSGGKFGGQIMKGNWAAVQFRVENASNFVNLTEIIFRYTTSPLNVLR